MYEKSLFLKKLESIDIPRNQVLALFANLGLPIPTKDQFFTTSDGGVMVFVNEAGIVVRLGSNKGENTCCDIRHPDIIQPIVQFDQDSLHVEILPGLRLGTNYDDANRLVDKLTKAGLVYRDRAGRIENIGYLPDGRAIILDRNAFAIGTYQNPPIDNVELPLSHTRQLLTKSFNQSISFPFNPDAQSNPRIFWEACKKMKDGGQLCNGWMDEQFSDIVHYHSHGQTSQAQRAAILYDNAIKSYWQTVPLSSNQIV